MLKLIFSVLFISFECSILFQVDSRQSSSGKNVVLLDTKDKNRWPGFSKNTPDISGWRRIHEPKSGTLSYIFCRQKTRKSWLAGPRLKLPSKHTTVFIRIYVENRNRMKTDTNITIAFFDAKINNKYAIWEYENSIGYIAKKFRLPLRKQTITGQFSLSQSRAQHRAPSRTTSSALAVFGLMASNGCIRLDRIEIYYHVCEDSSSISVQQFQHGLLRLPKTPSGLSTTGQCVSGANWTWKSSWKMSTGRPQYNHHHQQQQPSLGLKPIWRCSKFGQWRLQTPNKQGGAPLAKCSCSPPFRIAQSGKSCEKCLRLAVPRLPTHRRTLAKPICLKLPAQFAANILVDTQSNLARAALTWEMRLRNEQSEGDRKARGGAGDRISGAGPHFRIECIKCPTRIKIVGVPSARQNTREGAQKSPFLQSSRYPTRRYHHHYYFSAVRARAASAWQPSVSTNSNNNDKKRGKSKTRGAKSSTYKAIIYGLRANTKYIMRIFPLFKYSHLIDKKSQDYAQIYSQYEFVTPPLAASSSASLASSTFFSRRPKLESVRRLEIASTHMLNISWTTSSPTNANQRRLRRSAHNTLRIRQSVMQLQQKPALSALSTSPKLHPETEVNIQCFFMLPTGQTAPGNDDVEDDDANDDVDADGDSDGDSEGNRTEPPPPTNYFYLVHFQPISLRYFLFNVSAALRNCPTGVFAVKIRHFERSTRHGGWCWTDYSESRNISLNSSAGNTTRNVESTYKQPAEQNSEFFIRTELFILIIVLAFAVLLAFFVVIFVVILRYFKYGKYLAGKKEPTILDSSCNNIMPNHQIVNGHFIVPDVHPNLMAANKIEPSPIATHAAAIYPSNEIYFYANKSSTSENTVSDAACTEYNYERIRETLTTSEFSQTESSLLRGAPANQIYSTCPQQFFLATANPGTVLKYSNSSNNADIHQIPEIAREFIYIQRILHTGDSNVYLQGVLRRPASNYHQESVLLSDSIANNGVAIVLKASKCTDSNANTNDESVLNEARKLRTFHSPNIVQCFGIAKLGQISELERGEASSFGQQMIVIESMMFGNLSKFLRNNHSKIGLALQMRMLCDISAGLHHVHQSGWLHRAISAKNVFISANLQCKLGHFTRAVAQSDLTAQQTSGDCNCKPDHHRIAWLAPEFYTNAHSQCSPASDIWAVGICFWEVLSLGEQPYWNWSDHKIMQSVLTGYRLPPPSPSFTATINKHPLIVDPTKSNSPAHIITNHQREAMHSVQTSTLTLLHQLLLSDCWPANMQERISSDELCEKLIRMRANSSKYCIVQNGQQLCQLDELSPFQSDKNLIISNGNFTSAGNYSCTNLPTHRIVHSQISCINSPSSNVASKTHKIMNSMF